MPTPIIRSTLVPLLLHSIMRFRVPLLSPQLPLCLFSLLRVMRCHLSLPRQGGSPQVLFLLLVHVARDRLQSRMLARQRMSLPLAIPPLLASLTSFKRRVLTLVRSWKTLVRRVAVLRDGSASLSTRLLGLASGFTPGLGR